MSRVTASIDFDRVKPEDLPRFLNLFGEQILRVVNGGLDFDTNFNSKFVSAVFTSSGADTSIAHGLGRVPSGYIIVGLSDSMIVYDGVGANTTSSLILRASAAGTARLLVY